MGAKIQFQDEAIESIKQEISTDIQTVITFPTHLTAIHNLTDAIRESNQSNNVNNSAEVITGLKTTQQQKFLTAYLETFQQIKKTQPYFLKQKQ